MATLAGKTNIKLGMESGSVQARGGNYILNASAADIANYAREGADLVIEFANGEKLLIRDFFQGGMGANNLVLSNGDAMQIVDFSGALGGADGIIDGSVSFSTAAAGGANGVLMGLLGVAAAGAGVAVAVGASSGSDDGSDIASSPAVIDPDKAAGTKSDAAISVLKILMTLNEIVDYGDLEKIRKIADIDKIFDDIASGIDHVEENKADIDAIKDMIKGVHALDALDLLTAEVEKGTDASADLIKEYISTIKDGMHSIKDVKDINKTLEDLKVKVNDEASIKAINDIINGLEADRAADQINDILLDKEGNPQDFQAILEAGKNLDAIEEKINKGKDTITDIKVIEERIALIKAVKSIDALDKALGDVQDKNNDGKITMDDITDWKNIMVNLSKDHDLVKDIKGVAEIEKSIEGKLVNVMSKDIFNQLIDELAQLDDNAIAKDNETIQKLVALFKSGHLSDVKGINIEGIEKAADGLEVVNNIVKAIDEGKNATEIEGIIEAVKEASNGSPQEAFQIDLDDLIAASGEEESVSEEETVAIDDLFVASRDIASFDIDLPVSPLATEEDFANSMAAASQIMI